jgi:hypothetical protein
LASSGLPLALRVPARAQLFDAPPPPGAEEVCTGSTARPPYSALRSGSFTAASPG